MNLSKTGLLARFYNYNYGTKLPNDLCSFFWKTVASILLLPITILSAWSLLSGDTLSFGERVGFGVGTLVALLLLFCIVMSIVTAPVPSLITYGIFAVVIGSIIFYVRRKDRGQKSEAIEVIKERIKGFKEGYCPRIDWE